LWDKALIALLTRHNSYIGREYSAALIASGIDFDVLAFGNYPDYEKAEELRCGGLWRPLSTDQIAESRKVERFVSTRDERFFQHMVRAKYRFGIQGDIGEIIDKNLLSLFPEGIINFHPGDLPAYRGCDAPEWQLLHGLPVICTAHLVDEGIDTGPIIAKRQLTSSKGSYHRFRASLYPQIASFVAGLCSELLNKTEINSTPQESGIYRKRMSEEVREQMRQLFDRP
jgi:methionyl-tRNA formyltransferase